MQDGATSHTTNLNLNFLTEKFCGRVIFCRAQEGHFWPPYSPDLNPLNFCVWGYVQDQVRRIQPGAVEDVAGTIPEEMLRDAAQNVRKRMHACMN